MIVPVKSQKTESHTTFEAEAAASSPLDLVLRGQKPSQ